MGNRLQKIVSLHTHNYNELLQRDLALSIGYDLSKFDSEFEREQVKNLIQQDYARVDIYYQTLNVKDIKQSPVIGVSVLLVPLILPKTEKLTISDGLSK